LEAATRPARAQGAEQTAAAAPAALRKWRRVIADNRMELLEELFILSPREIVCMLDQFGQVGYRAAIWLTTKAGEV